GLAQAQLQQDLSQQLSSLPAGYVLKDPRFVLTLDAWWDQLFAHVPEAQRPLLVWIRRNFAEVAQSYRRRNYYIQRDGQQVLGLYGLTLAELHAQAAQQYLRWPGEKLILDFKQLENAHRLFKLGKSARSRIELHRAKEASHG